MEVVKLNRRFTAFKHGFTHAIRFTEWNEQVINVERVLRNRYGWDWGWEKEWKGFRGAPRSTSYDRPYYYALRNEAMVSQILLSI